MENRDYKYVMQDTGNLYLGSKFSYEEMIYEEDVPFKLKAIIERYILTEIDKESTLESHFYYMKKEGFAYETYRQLKAKVKVSILQEKKNIFGKISKTYVDRLFPLEKFCQLDEKWKKDNGVFIQEVQLSKLSLLTFAA